MGCKVVCCGDEYTYEELRMSTFVVELPDIVMPLANPSNSPTQNTKLTHQDALALVLSAPASTEATVIQGSHDGTNFFELNRLTNAVAGPAAGESEVYGLGCPNPPIITPYWRIVAPAGCAAARTIKVAKLMAT